MRIMVIGLDRSVADPSSAAAVRQRQYFAGWQADIVVLAPGETKKVELAPGITVYVTGGTNRPAAFWRGLRLARRLSCEKPYDVVSVQDPWWSGLLGWLVKPKRCGFHLQDHSGFFARPSFYWHEFLLRPCSKFLARRAARIRTVSQRGRDGLVALGIDPGKIDVIPIATDLARFRDVPPPTFDAPRVLCVARLEREKGIADLLMAWQAVVAQQPSARLRIVGKGSERHALERLRDRLGITSSVEFSGHHSDVMPDLAWTNLAVQPSKFEGWGLSVIEAAAAGRPLVMTDVGCAGEVIRDKQEGIVVAVGDAAALAEGVLSVIRDPVLAAKLAKAARDRVQTLPDQAATVAENRHSMEKARRAVRLLVVVQAADQDDPLFGFFHGWLTHAARHFPNIIVAALRVGRHHLPANVEVAALRPASSRSRLSVMGTLWSLSWRRRRDYDAVFVRGDAQYLVLTGWLWKILRKPCLFWYTHASAKSPWFWLAVPWASAVVTAVPESNPLRSAIPIGHHLDLEAFPLVERKNDGPPSVLVFGRMSPVKRVELILRALKPVVESGTIKLSLVGKASDEGYAETLRRLLPAGATWEDRDVPPSEAPALYASADAVVNATEASLDKVILEAAASGRAVFAATPGFLRGLPASLRWLSFTSEIELRDGVARFASLTPEERARIGRELRVWVAEHHSMERHLDRLAERFESL